MAYATSNPPRLVDNAGLTGAGQVWTYRSTDALATVVAATYITNAQDLGMKVGDLVLVQDTSTPAQAFARVTAVASTGSTMSAGLAIT
jgi:hypothetical protein